MQWWIGTDRLVEALRLALLVEKGVLVRLVDKEVKLEVAPRELHAARNGSPFTECDRPVVRSAIRQRIPAHNILPQHIPQAFLVALCAILFAYLFPHLSKQSQAASLGIVLQQLDTIARAYGNKALKLPFRL